MRTLVPCTCTLLLVATGCPTTDSGTDTFATFGMDAGQESTTEPGEESTEDGTETGPDTGDEDCGNGTVEEGETCDLGPENSDSGACTTLCQIAECGDGFTYEEFEDCDDGNPINTDDCIDNCQLASCGDGFTQAGVEECDDGNDNEADGCTSSCVTGVCGDGIVQDGEQCDDGDDDTADDCPACQLAFCGDGYVQLGVEVCDDGNMESNDDCVSPFCTPAECGDGNVNEGVEECDDGNLEPSDACTDVCAMAYCGDGIEYEGFEECDDGDDDNTDGCDDQCIAYGDPQCFEPYTTLNLANRNVTAVNQVVICDQNNSDGQFNGPGWYRFEGAAGVMMPEAVPQEYACGTHAPGWLNTPHPQLADGVVNRQVCFNWSGNNCQWNAQIQVVACPDFYLYQLPNTPVCSLRYCGTN
jgi:cysteine-rich repeat protein